MTAPQPNASRTIIDDFGVALNDLARSLAALEPMKPPEPDPRDPDYSRQGVFQTHNCYRCRNGERACVYGRPGSCDFLRARND